MSYYAIKKQRGKRKAQIGVVLFIVVLLCIAAVFTVKSKLEGQKIALDPATQCPVTGSPAYFAVVFDKTDAYNKIQQKFLKRYFEQFKESLPVGAQVSLYVIDDKQAEEIKPKFIICKPRTGKDANALYENPDLINKRWNDKFVKPLDGAIEYFMSPSTSSTSPIMEMFQIVSLSAFPPGSEDIPKQIVLVSDMIHHSSEWSHYRGQMDIKQLMSTAYYQKLSTDLHGAEVVILYIRREGAEALQTKRHALFWADYVESIGGRVTLIERVDG
jgi:hypothetical protein